MSTVAEMFGQKSIFVVCSRYDVSHSTFNQNLEQYECNNFARV